MTARSPIQANGPGRAASSGGNSVAEVRLAEFVALVEREREALMTLAYRFCWNHANADDAVQEALMIATERLEQLEDDSRMAAWLRAIVARQALTRARRARSERRFEAERLVCDGLTTAPPDSLDLDDGARNLRAWIGALPERQQMAIVLRHVCEMDYSEVADLMNAAESTVRVLVKQAREKVQRRMADAGMGRC